MNLSELLELLYTARNRFSTIQVSWRYWYRPDLMSAAQDKWMAEQPPVSVAVLSSISAKETGSETQDEMGRVIRRRVWWQKPSFWRREEHAKATIITIIHEDDFWSFSSARNRLYTNVMPDEGPSHPNIRRVSRRKGEHFPDLEQEIKDVPIVDPSFLLATHELQRMESTVFAGREAVRVRGVFRKGRDLGWEPRFWGFADEHEFLVDEERGILLRYAARFKQQDFAVASVEQVIFDEPIPESVFIFTPPPSTFVEVVH
jgi:outer membrane lipoprotein-sorting protein